LAKEIIEPKSKPERDLEQHKAIELKEAIHVDQNSEDVDIKKSSVEINSPTIKTMITDLRKYLDDSNAASHESFEKLNNELSQHGFESSLQRLGKSVGEYNMEDAANMNMENEIV